MIPYSYQLSKNLNFNSCVYQNYSCVGRLQTASVVVFYGASGVCELAVNLIAKKIQEFCFYILKQKSEELAFKILISGNRIDFTTQGTFKNLSDVVSRLISTESLEERVRIRFNDLEEKIFEFVMTEAKIVSTLSSNLQRICQEEPCLYKFNLEKEMDDMFNSWKENSIALINEYKDRHSLMNPLNRLQSFAEKLTENFSQEYYALNPEIIQRINDLFNETLANQAN